MNGNIERLISWFNANGESAIVALSGGVDSALVAYIAKKALGDRAIAVTADYKTLAKDELESAKNIAEEIGMRHIIIEYNELENPDFVKNDIDRCYHCRNELAEHIIKIARENNISLIVDGTNADDLNDFRPGIKALKAHGIRSPLAELSIGKDEVRVIAKMLSLSVYDKPSNACLASRIPHGMEVTYERLARIERAENIIKEVFGVKQVRVRDHEDVARIEVGRDERRLLFDEDKLDILDSRLRELGFRFVSIDARGYRSGSLNAKMIRYG